MATPSRQTRGPAGLIEEWFKHEVIEDNQSKTNTSDALDHFWTWLNRREDRRTVQAKWFRQKMISLGQKPVEFNGRWYYAGIKLRE